MMDKLHLEIPTIERKEDALEYLQEHIKIGSNLNGTGGLKRCLNEITYEEWLEDIIKTQTENYAKSKNLVTATTYFTIRKSDNKIIGMVNLRHYLNDYLMNFGGHIGYGIRPLERKKGYAKIQLYLTLLEAQKLGIDRVMIDCINTNIASEKTIQALGGEFDKEVYEENRKETLRNYWIDVNDSIEKYKDKYNPSTISEIQINKR